MRALRPLEPAIAAERFYPKDAAYMARTDLAQTRMLGYTPAHLDAVTSLMLGLLHERPAVRHRAGVTDEGLALLEHAGLRIAEDMRVYETGEDAERHADRLIEEGFRLFWPYPLREGRFPAEAQLVAPALWRRLNAKRHLDQLVTGEHLAPRRLLELDDGARAQFDRPVFVKAAGDGATGWGYAVRYCAERASLLQAIEWLREAGETSILVEDEAPVRTCWCVTIVVEADQTTCAGAAEQAFAAPGRQAGSVIDPENSLPETGVRLAVAVGEAARRAGYVGLAGLDIGLTDDGRLIVFDPNFRVNSSSTQVLLHAAAAQRAGLAVSASVNKATALPFGELLRRLRGPIEDGWFVPTRLLDAAWLPSANGNSTCTGFVLGADRADASARQSALESLLD